MFSKGKMENELLGGSRVKQQKGERSLLMAWKLISIRDGISVKVEIVGILSASHPLEKTNRKGGGDSRRFSNQNVHETCIYAQSVDNNR